METTFIDTPNVVLALVLLAGAVPAAVTVLAIRFVTRFGKRGVEIDFTVGVGTK